MKKYRTGGGPLGGVWTLSCNRPKSVQGPRGLAQVKRGCIGVGRGATEALGGRRGGANHWSFRWPMGRGL